MSRIPEYSRPQLPARVDVEAIHGVARSPHVVVAHLSGDSKADRYWVRAWRRLGREAPTVLAAEFFEAIATWRARGDVVVAGAGAGDKLLSALPLERSRFGELRGLRSAESRLQYFGDERSVPMLWRSVQAATGWHLLELRGIPEAGVLAEQFVNLAHLSGCRVEITPAGRAPYFPFDALDDLDPDLAEQLQATRTALPRLTYERVATADPRALEHLFAMKRESGAQVALGAEQRGFFSDIAQCFARRRQLTLAFLKIGGTRVAGHLALEDGKTVALIASGEHPDFRLYKPQQLLLYLSAQDARRRGLREFEFPGEPMTDHPAGFTRRARPLTAIRIYRGAVGHARHYLEYHARPTVRRYWNELRMWWSLQKPVLVAAGRRVLLQSRRGVRRAATAVSALALRVADFCRHRSRRIAQFVRIHYLDLRQRAEIRFQLEDKIRALKPAPRPQQIRHSTQPARASTQS